MVPTEHSPASNWQAQNTINFLYNPTSMNQWQYLPNGNYESKTDKPQLAHEMYLRLLSIAKNKTENYAANDIFLAAFTGCNLMYTAASTAATTNQDQVQ